MPSQHVRILLTTCKWDKEKLLERSVAKVLAFDFVSSKQLHSDIMLGIRKHCLLRLIWYTLARSQWYITLPECKHHPLQGVVPLLVLDKNSFVKSVCLLMLNLRCQDWSVVTCSATNAGTAICG